nr:InlB B-repeat-containing protein [Lachnospiraceae bacterium]
MKKRLLSILIILAFVIADTRSAFAASGLFALSADAEAASQQLEEAETQETEVQETEAVDLLQQETEEQDGEEQSGEKAEEPADETGEEVGEEKTADLSDAEGETDSDINQDNGTEEPDETVMPEELLAEDAGETVYPTGYVRPFNYRDPETAVSDSELLQGTLESKYISPVVNDHSLRNQNPYGTCWAFASMGLAESSLLRQGIMTDTDLSELHLAYFTFNGVADPLGNTAGDQAVSASKKGILNWGGNFDWAGNTMASWTGAAKEEKASYSGKASTINSGGSLDPSIAYDDIAHLKDIYRVSLHNNTDDVKELIKAYGGAGVSFYAQDGLSPTTSERLYNSKTNSYYCDAAVQANHAVMIVGWDDQYSKNNFSATPEGDGAWLIRNSWTTGTYANRQSFSGYFWMSYYDKSLEDEATFFVFDDAGEYDNNYQYDGGVQDGYVYGARKIANVFKTQSEAGGTEQLKAVSFALYSTNADYTINIYKNLTNPSNPESGTKVLSQEGSTVYGGLHTVELNRTVELAQDETFSVVIDFNGASQKVFYEYALDIGVCDFRTNAQSGQSFAQFGSSWSDFGAGYHGNLRIKAFTTNASEEQILPQRLVLEEGLAESGVTLNKEETHQVTWNVLPQEATDKKVLWESSDEGIATVSSTGLVTAVAQGSAVITGKTRAGDASASFTVTVTKELKGLQIVSSTDGNPVVGEECRFSAQTVPVGAPLNNTITWSSSDPSILSVTETGGVATIHHAGTVTVTADAGDGITGTLTVTCILPAPASVSARASGSGITLTWTKVTNADKYRIAGTYHRSSGATTVKTLETANTFFMDNDYPSDTVYVTYGVSAFENGIGGKTAYTTLYLVEQTYNITYHLGIGENDPRNPHKLTQNEDVYLYDPVAPEGYDALGWYEAHLDGLTNSLPLLKNGVRWYTDYSLTAKYEPHTYQIRYFANSGSGVMSDTSATYGKSVTLRANAFTKPGYDFDGWNTEPDGSGTTYANRASVKNLTSKDNDVVRLYAMWSGAKFNVTLNAGKGTLLSGTKKVNSLTMQVETEGIYKNLPVPERYGYDFTGWYTEEDDGGILVKNGMDVLSDVTILYAGWKAMDMPVSFDGNGETIPTFPKTVTYGESYGTLKEPDSNADREFAGWFLEPECLTQITKNTVVTKAGAHTLYAGWMRKEKIAAPVILTSEGTDEISSKGTVEIRCGTAGVVIYYTTDGSEPSKSSFVYAGTFTLPLGNTTVKAVAVKNSELLSEVSAKTIKVYESGNEYGDLADHADDKALYIAKGRPSGIWMAGIGASGYAYSGVNITPEVRIYDGTRLLK